MEFEVIYVKKDNQRILVEIEILGTRERKSYGYPIGEGWEIEINGEFKFLRDIRKKLENEEEVSKVEVDFIKINNSVKGKKIKVIKSK